MKNELNVGIVGCGKIAHVDHVPGLLNVKGVRVGHLFDVAPEKMAVLDSAFKLDACCHGSLDSLLASGLDAVVVCTPNSLHYEQTLAALKAGCHVLCEKPMAATSPECTRMISAARKAGRILHINQTLHYWPGYVTFARLVAAGKIGEVQHVRCLRFHDSSPDVGWSPGATWFVSKKFAGGIVLDIGVHMADVMKWVAGSVREISAVTETRIPGIDVVDNARALLHFDSGATGTLELSWTSPVNAGFVEVYGTKGVLRMGFPPNGATELIQPVAGKPMPGVSTPKDVKGVPTSQQSFVNAIRGKGESFTPGELGRDAVALCEAVLKAGETGRPVKVRRFDA